MNLPQTLPSASGTVAAPALVLQGELGEHDSAPLGCHEAGVGWGGDAHYGQLRELAHDCWSSAAQWTPGKERIKTSH